MNLKKRFENISIVNKMRLLNVVGITTAVLIFFILFSTAYYFFARHLLGNKIYAQANLLAVNTAPMLAFFDIEEAHKLAVSLKQIEDFQRVAIFDKDSQAMVDLNSPGKKITGELNKELLKQNKAVKKFNITTIRVYFPILLENEKLGTVVIESTTETIKHNIVFFLCIGSIATLAGILFSTAVFKRLQMLALNPIISMSKIAEQVAGKKDYSLRIDINGNDEVANLALRFNEMLAKVERWEKDLHEEILQRRESEQKLDILARTDELTGLGNRLAFKADLSLSLETECRNMNCMAMMIIDLDDFKMINDNYGHNSGDIVLRQAAKTISGALRGGDTLYRIGGDEFAALIKNINSANNIEPICKRIIRQVGSSVQLDYDNTMIDVSIGASLGVALYPNHGQSSETLFHHADVAMYESKKKGKNSFTLFDSELLRNKVENRGLI